MRRFVPLGAIALLMASIFVATVGARIADAYQLSGQRWCDGWADLSFMTSAGIHSYTLDRASVQNGASSWSNAGSATLGGKVNFNYAWDADNTTSARLTLYSSYQTINGTLALTSYAYNPFNGCINTSGANIEWNTAYGFNPSSTTCDFTSGWFSMYAVSAHELGHGVGLAHSGDTNAIMYATRGWCTYQESLTGDDTAGIIAIYGQTP